MPAPHGDEAGDHPEGTKRKSRSHRDEAGKSSKPGKKDMKENDEDYGVAPQHRTALQSGLKLVREGKAANDKSRTDKAYDKYCRGLQLLLQIIPSLSDDNPKGKELKIQVHGYLDEAEQLKRKLHGPKEGEEAKPPAEASKRQRSRSPGADGRQREHAVPSKAVPPLPKRRRTMGSRQAAAPAERAPANEPEAPTIAPELQSRIDEGESLIKEGEDMERNGQAEEAYERYCRGLQYLLEVMPKLGGEDSPTALPLKTRIRQYLEQAERLHDKMEKNDDGRTNPSGKGGSKGEGRGLVLEPADPRNAASDARSRSRSGHHRHRRKHHSSRHHRSDGGREEGPRHHKGHSEEDRGSERRGAPPGALRGSLGGMGRPSHSRERGRGDRHRHRSGPPGSRGGGLDLRPADATRSRLPRRDSHRSDLDDMGPSPRARGPSPRDRMAPWAESRPKAGSWGGPPPPSRGGGGDGRDPWEATPATRVKASAMSNMGPTMTTSKAPGPRR